MAADGGEDGLLLNLAVAQAPAPHLSRTQQRKQKWTQQRAAKASALQRSGVAHVLERALLRCLCLPSTREHIRMQIAYAGQGRRHARSCRRRSCRRSSAAHPSPPPSSQHSLLAPTNLQKQAHKHGGGAGAGGRGRPSWLGGGQQQQAPEAPTGGGGQLKGYSLGGDAPAAPAPAPAAAPAAPPKQPPQQQRQGDSGRSAFGAGDKSQPQRGRQPLSQQQQQPSAPRQHQHQQRLQHDGQQPRSTQQQQQRGDKPRQQVVAQARSGVELAKAHFERRQARHAPKQQQQQRDDSPQPPAAAPAGGAGGAKRGGAGEDGERPSKRIGKLRLASRQAGYREPTPGVVGGAWVACLARVDQVHLLLLGGAAAAAEG